MPTIEAYSGLTGMDYAQTVSWMEQLYGVSSSQIDEWCQYASQYGVSEMDALADFAGQYGMNLTKDAAGNFNVTNFTTVAQETFGTNLPNSNLQTTARSKFNVMLNRAKDASDKLNITRYPASGSFAQKAGYVVGSVGSAVGAVSAGIALGKTIDSTLYNLNPNFWDENGMSAINPETWNSITSGDNSWQAGLFNMIFGLDPDTGNTQAYMDANAFALMAMYMNQMGVFATGGYTAPTTNVESPSGTFYDFVNMPDIIYSSGFAVSYRNGIETYSFSSPLLGWIDYSNRSFTFVSFSSIPFTITRTEPNGTVTTFNSYNYNNGYFGLYYGYNLNDYETNYGGLISYPFNYFNYYPSRMNKSVDGSLVTSGMQAVNAYFVSALSNGHSSEPIAGIGSQDGATLPDTTGWNDIPSTLQSLQNQYPDMFNDALVWDNVQPDGSNPQLTYLPVPFPDITSYNDTQPTSSPLSQAASLINQTILPETLIDTITKLLQQPETQPQTDTQTTTQNPVDTGTGDTTAPILPVGSASALWSVYNPTQGEVDSFGAWLWSSPFETNIGKLFQNPIDGVITLHKIFATPDTAANANIVVGTLDSGVSSATVPSQYVTVDCGSVNLYEDFANVFDYPPFTSVSLYLPFIGIVPLDTNDVMRSTITVTYGVDVYTGACLAMVEVSRDGNTVNMYQYAGVCSVEYPITNVQHSQMVGGLLSIAGGVAAMLATGVAGPAALAVAGGIATTAKSQIGHSGSFSGNAGAMGIKNPYLIIQRPQTKVADYFPSLAGYPTNVSGLLGEFSGQVVVSDVHVENIFATDYELSEIESLLKSGVLV